MIRPYTPACEIAWLRRMRDERRHGRNWWLALLRWNRNRRWDFPDHEAEPIIEFIVQVLRARDYAV